jgi:hypothetical protein
MRKSNKNHELKCVVKDTLYNPLSQAIIKLVETPYFTLKAFIFTCILISIGLCAYLIIELVRSYLTFGVSTTTRTVYETSVVFPKVTICNVNPFTTRHALEFLKQINREFYPLVDVFNATHVFSAVYATSYSPRM